MKIPRPVFGLLLCASLFGVNTAAGAAKATKVEVIATDKSEEVGDISVTWDDGKSEQLTRGAHAEQAKLGPDGLIGWAWSKERYQDVWVSEYLRVQRGKELAFEVKSGKPFIEDWAFIPEGVVVKSRGMHGPALIELFSLSDGKPIKTITKAFGDDLPEWAKPYADLGRGCLPR
jgi:hypothetical protein